MTSEHKTELFGYGALITLVIVWLYFHNSKQGSNAPIVVAPLSQPQTSAAQSSATQPQFVIPDMTELAQGDQPTPWFQQYNLPPQSSLPKRTYANQQNAQPPASASPVQQAGSSCCDSCASSSVNPLPSQINAQLNNVQSVAPIILGSVR